MTPDEGEPRSHPDLRLFGFAAGTWGASLGALQTSLSGAVWIGGAAAVAAAGLSVIVAGRGRRPRRLGIELARPGHFASWAVVAILLGVICGAASAAARLMVRDADPLAVLAQGRARVSAAELTVADDPRPLRSSRAGPIMYLVPARLTQLVAEGVGVVRLDAQVIVFGTNERWQSLLPSQRVVTAARLAPAGGEDLTAAIVSAIGQPELLGQPSWAQVAAAVLRAGLQTACTPLPAAAGGLLPGLVIGDTSRLDPALADEFRATGLTHLVAVSGANVAIVLGVVLFAARWCRAGPWLAAAICVAALAGFVILARPSPSVVRAAAMGSVGLLALASGRPTAAAPALAAAVVAGLLVDPDLAVDPGFALSVLATGGLILLAPRWRDALRARGVPAGVAEALAVSAAAQVAVAPVVAALSGSVSIIAVPANLLAVPAVAPATLFGVLAAVMSPLWPDLAELLAWLASWPARWLVAIAHVGAGIPAGAVPWPAGPVGGLALAALTVGVLLAARRPVLLRTMLVAAVGVAVGAVPIRLVAPGWPPDGAVVVACDVGQGDAIVLPTAPGEAVVIDAGPDPVPVDACLRRLGIRTVPILVLTHFHVDHIGGIAGVVRGRSIGAIVIGTFDEPAAGERAVRAVAARTPVVEVEPGWNWVRGSLDLRVFGPAQQLSGTRSDANNNSLLIRVVSRGISVLLVGDAESEEQHAAVRTLDRETLRADVLKVAHHGSAFQDVEFLHAVDPDVALVSVGADNPYGHPTAPLLARLARDGARVLRTDLDGDIAVVVTETGLGFVVAGPDQ